MAVIKTNANSKKATVSAEVIEMQPSVQRPADIGISDHRQDRQEEKAGEQDEFLRKKLLSTVHVGSIFGSRRGISRSTNFNCCVLSAGSGLVVE